MSNDKSISRRVHRREHRVAAAASFGGVGAALGGIGKGGGHSIPPGHLGVQQFSGARCDRTAQHRVQQPARRDADHGLPRRSGLSGRPDRPRRARAAPGGCAGCSSTSPRSTSRASSSSSRRRTRTSSIPSSRRLPRSAVPRRGRLEAVGTHQFGLGNLDPATGNLTPAGETLFEFLSTLGMETMGFSGNLSQLPNNSRRGP